MCLKGGLQTVLISGPPGIGKTRLASEMYAVAEKRGALCAGGTWQEGTRLPELWVWRRVLREILADYLRSGLRNELLPAVSEISGILPELRDRLPGLPAPYADLGPQNRVRLYDAVLRLLFEVCERKPVFILFDNLHLASSPSLDLLGLLFAEMPRLRLLVVGSYRNVQARQNGPFLTFLAETRQSPAVHEYLLGNLEPADSARAVRYILGCRPPEDFCANVHSITGGNPLFVTEAAMLCRGRIDGHIKDAHRIFIRELPSVIGTTINLRLRGIPPDERRLLCRFAALGEPFLREEAFWTVEEEDLHRIGPALEAGIAQGFLDAVKETGEYRFSHEVVRSALLSEVPLPDRPGLYRRIAEGAEKLTEQTPYLLLRLSEWWGLAGGKNAKKKERMWIRKAAEAALLERGWGQAIELFEKLVPPEGPSAEGDEEAELLSGLGRAYAFSGDIVTGIRILRRSFAWHLARKNFEAMFAIATLPVYLNAGDPGFFDFFTPILESLPPHSDRRGMVLHFLGVAHFNGTGRYGESLRCLREAYEISRERSNDCLGAYCLTALAYLDNRFGRPLDALGKTEKASAMMAGRGDFYLERHFHSETAQALVDCGRAGEALSLLESYLPVVESQRESFPIANCCHMLSRLEAFAGNWLRAREYVDRGLSALPGLVWLLSLRSYIEYTVGNFPDGDVYKARIAASSRRTPPGPYSVHIASASTAVVRCMQGGGPDELRLLPGMLSDTADRSDAHPFVTVRANILLCFIAAIFGDASLAQARYKTLKKLETYNLVRPYHVERALGLAAHACGNHPAAAAHLEKALNSARRYGDRPLSALILYDAYRARPDRDRRILSETWELASELGMKPLLERLAAEDEAPNPHVHLSAREAEVLALIARGFANKEIAFQLGISYYTAVNHVRNIIKRTGAANRVEAVERVKKNLFIK